MQLIPLDINNETHIDITYEILVSRFRNERINIDGCNLPTREQHIDRLKSGIYKYYYLYQYREYFVGIIYIIEPNNEFGTFLHLKNALSAYRKYKNEIDRDIGTVIIDKKKITRMVYFFGVISFRAFREKHPDLQPLTAKVKYDNIMSKRFAEYGLMFKPKYVYYEY